MKLAELQEVLRRVQEEAAAPEAPYDDLYHAAEELESKIKALEGRGQAVPLKLASLHCQRGCILLETGTQRRGSAAEPLMQSVSGVNIFASYPFLSGPNQQLQCAEASAAAIRHLHVFVTKTLCLAIPVRRPFG